MWIDLILAGWCLVVVVMDLRFRRVDWRWTLAGILVSAVYRCLLWFLSGFDLLDVLMILLVFTGSWTLWKNSIWGGADAKTAMTLVLAVPEGPCWILIGGTVWACATVLDKVRGGITIDEPGEHVCKEMRNSAAQFPMAAALCLGALLCFVVHALIPAVDLMNCVPAYPFRR